MNEQEKKRQRIYDLLNAETKAKFLCLPYAKLFFLFFLQKKSSLRKRESRELNKKWKESVTLATAIKVDSMSIRKYANELKVQEKTVRTAINF